MGVVRRHRPNSDGRITVRTVRADERVWRDQDLQGGVMCERRECQSVEGPEGKREREIRVLVQVVGARLGAAEQKEICF